MRHLFILIFCWLSLSTTGQPSPYVQLVNGTFMLNNQPFIPKGVNFITELYDNGGTIEVRPHHCYGYIPTPNDYECNNQTTCDVRLKSYFDELHNNLNCNTIRVALSGFAGPSDCNATTFNMYYLPNVAPNYNILTPVNDLTFLAAYYAHILDIANQAGLKVILTLGGEGSSCLNNSTLQTIYNNYLTAVANACKNKPALLAYDLWNEPQFARTDGGNTKQQVCQMSNGWYNLVKAADPNHLVTVGLAFFGFNADVFEWSVDVFKADFIALHLYPDFNADYTITSGVNTIVQNNDYDNITGYNERFLTTIKWLQNNMKVPWMMGETGYRAKPGPVDTRMDGSPSNQANYLNYTFEKTLQAGGIGYLWWQYRDVYWGVPNDPGQDNFGVVNKDGSYKPAATALASFNPYTIANTPLAYPSNYQNVLNNAGTAITGNVSFVPSNTQGYVNEAVVNGTREQINTTTNNTEWVYGVHTIASPNGNYNLVSKSPDLPGNNIQTKINRIYAGALDYKNSGTGALGITATTQNFALNALTNTLLLDALQTLPVLTNNATNIIEVRRNLYIYGAFTQGANGNSNNVFRAGNQIRIQESGFEPGNDVQAFITPMGYNCSLLPNTRLANAIPGRNATTNNQATINQLQPSLNDTTFVIASLNINDVNVDCLIYPNPTQNTLFVKSQQNITFIKLINNLGQTLNVNSTNISSSNDVTITKQLNLQGFTGGIYLLQIEFDNGYIHNQKIIKVN